MTASSATERVETTLAAIDRVDPALNSFTLVTRERAREEARAIDARRARGDPLPPLAGVPYAVKNLFDIEGEVTLAGSKVRASSARATGDAALVARMRAAGAILVGALAMDEFAYGFTTENSHYGPTRNPHDVARSAGGSSGGCGAAVAARLVPLALGSDTNGSIRVPASLCGVWGLKPTFGRLSRRGSFPFVASLDHLGPFAATLDDLARCYDVLQGADLADPACANRRVEPVAHEIGRGVAGLRIARLGGYFDDFAGDEARAAVAAACRALAVDRVVELPEASHGRAAAFVVTAAEGGALHLDDLRERYDDLEPLSRDRFAAGAILPASWYLEAQRVRAWYRARAARLFEDVDVLLAPATPTPAPRLGAQSLDLPGLELAVRANLGLLTQPISCIGWPVVAAPIPTDGALPVGVQVIAAPWREDLAFRVAGALAAAGVARSPLPGIHA